MTEAAEAVEDKKPTTINVSRDNVLIKPTAPMSETESGLAVIAVNKVAPKTGVVIKVGPGWWDKKGHFLQPPCEAGDYVIFAQGNLNEVELFDEKFVVVPASEILLVIR